MRLQVIKDRRLQNRNSSNFILSHLEDHSRTCQLQEGENYHSHQGLGGSFLSLSGRLREAFSVDSEGVQKTCWT